jgi:hypothetical protein
MNFSKKSCQNMPFYECNWGIYLIYNKGSFDSIHGCTKSNTIKIENLN